MLASENLHVVVREHCFKDWISSAFPYEQFYRVQHLLFLDPPSLPALPIEELQTYQFTTVKCQHPIANCQLPFINFQLPSANSQTKNYKFTLRTANKTANWQLTSGKCQLTSVNCKVINVMWQVKNTHFRISLIMISKNTKQISNPVWNSQYSDKMPKKFPKSRKIAKSE